LVPPSESGFERRPNRDGTTDLVCTKCFDTVCTSHVEADLDRAQAAHTCDPFLLQRWRLYSGRRGPEPKVGEQKKSPVAEGVSPKKSGATD